MPWLEICDRMPSLEGNVHPPCGSQTVHGLVQHHGIAMEHAARHVAISLQAIKMRECGCWSGFPVLCYFGAGRIFVPEC